jgi:hypothetical protein
MGINKLLVLRFSIQRVPMNRFRWQRGKSLMHSGHNTSQVPQLSHGGGLGSQVLSLTEIHQHVGDGFAQMANDPSVNQPDSRSWHVLPCHKDLPLQGRLDGFAVLRSVRS